MAAQVEKQPPAEAVTSSPPTPPSPTSVGDASPTPEIAPPQAQGRDPVATDPSLVSSGSPSPREQQPQDDVDSALLSALRDSRERMALLKLERVLVGFMRERTTGYIEVGGQYNSIVIGGGAKVAGAAGSSSGNGGGSGGASKTVVQPQGAGRQTTFQRLCLHRLADRFGIVRESASTILEYEGEGGAGVGSGGAGGMAAGFQPTLIRLVKTKDSKIPSNLLIDLDPSAYCLSGSGSDGDGVKGITRNLSTSRLSDTSDKGGIGKAPIPSGGSGKPRKMVIMKRSSSKLGTGSSDSLRGDGKGRRRGNKIKGKNLSDKEKVYAEARARILGEHAGEVEEDDNGGRQSPNEGRRHSNGGNGTGENLAVQSPSGSPPPPSTESTLQPSPPNTDACESGEVATQEQPPPKERGGRGRHRDGNRSSYKRDSANSKVTWRNRRQEETDPDFRRGGSLVLNAAAPAVTVQGPLHAQQPAVIHYGASGPVAMGYAYANGAAVAAPMMVAAPQMGHPSVGIHVQQQPMRGGGNVTSPLSSEGKVFYPQQAAAMHQQQYYYQGGMAATVGGHGGQPPAQAQPFVPQQRGVYQYQPQQAQVYYGQGPAPHQRGSGNYASAQGTGVADVRSMEEFPSLGGGSNNGSSGVGGESGGEKK
eukprot:CAMPEP_0113534160 /NCGR_PEP_ID=MMETSP0015_2-20120614/5008_1 /TAXON_ID=2838 /ORGANISM="Odontella" /LENGTH=646 /DNA_ID=CAMNT_0000433297 /DNA_START=782 /DNA_END=2722 /DNA_ORIENTATION=+ /assembly_acc=CAM_ASM_000160